MLACSAYVLVMLVRAPSVPTPVYCSTIRVISEWMRLACKIKGIKMKHRLHI